MPTATRKTKAKPRRRSTATRKPAAAAPELTPPPIDGRIWYLQVPFRAIVPGAVWDPVRKAHTFAGPELPAHLLPYQSQQYTVLRWKEDIANRKDGPPAPQVAPMIPRPLQIEGAQVIVDAASTVINGAAARGFLLTDDTGTGKTITAWLAIRAIAKQRKARKVLVLVDRPKEITIPHWRRTISAIGDGGLQVLIASIDELPHLTVGSKPRWNFDLIVADEAHNMRNPETARVKRFRAVSRFTAKHTDAPFVLWMTATPGNHPVEMTYLAPVLAQIHGNTVTSWSEFGKRLHIEGIPIEQGKYGKWVWNEHAADRPKVQQAATLRIRKWLADNDPPLTLYRAAPWGAAPLDLMPVTLAPEERIAYDTAWSEFQQAMIALSDSRSPATAAAVAKQGRVAVLRFRQKASMLRVGHTVQWVMNAVAAGKQVPVSCEFVGAAAEPISDQLEALGVPVSRIYGSPTSGRDAELERMRFQTGQTKVVVFTPTSSLSLQANEQLADGRHGSTAHREAVMHNVRYSGIAARQVLGRSHRDHQICPWWLAYTENTQEEQIAQIMVTRLKATADTAGADSSTLVKIAAILGVSWLPSAVLAADDTGAGI